MSGSDIATCSGWLLNNNAYYHSPLLYLANLSDDWFLGRFNHNYYVAVGNGDTLFEPNVWKLSNLFEEKGIPHLLDVWKASGMTGRGGKGWQRNSFYETDRHSLRNLKSR